jgi:hypothetical protein
LPLPLFLFAIHDLADGIHRLADATPDMTFSFLGLAFRFQVAIT